MFLPTTIKEVRARGWEQLDVILFSGDAYIDHPAFGAAVIGRLLEAEGYRVAIVPQPNWRDDLRDFTKLGTPRLFFGITAGSMDSMVNHYTANIRLRSNDAYTPGGKAGFRPDYAVTVYTRIVKRLFPHVPVVVGGDRGFPTAADALRLLERFAQAFGAGRKRRRPADLRHGRTGRTAGRPGTAQRIQCQVAAQTAAGGVHGRQRLRGAARPGGDDPAALLRGVRARQTGFRGEFHGHRDTEQPDGTDSDAGRGRGRPLRGRHAAQHNAHDRRTRPLVRPALRTGTAPALQRQGGISRLGR